MSKQYLSVSTGSAGSGGKERFSRVLQIGQEVGIADSPLDDQIDFAAEEVAQGLPQGEVLPRVVGRGERRELHQEIHVAGRWRQRLAMRGAEQIQTPHLVRGAQSGDLLTEWGETHSHDVKVPLVRSLVQSAKGATRNTSIAPQPEQRPDFGVRERL